MKATRRELRRAVGPAALGTIQAQEQTIAILQNAVATCQREIASLAVNHAAFKKATGAELTDYRRMLVTVFALRNRPFLGRLRWLFIGK